MRKKILTFLSLMTVLVVMCSSLAFAVVTTERTLPRVNDEAGVLDANSVEALNKKYDELSEKYEFDFAALTVNSTNGQDVESFSDDYFDYNGFGIGNDNSGVVLVISFDPRECYISACGDGTRYFDYYECQDIIDKFYSELKAGDYAEVFDIFADEVEKYLNGTYGISSGDYYGDYDDSEYVFGDNYYDGKDENVGILQTIKNEWHTLVLIPVCIGVIFAALTVFALTRGNKSVRMNDSARTYQVPGSFVLSNSEDNFTHTSVSKTPRAQDNSDNNFGSGSGGGIGSSGTHVGSSGASHSGGGRGF